MHERKIFSIVYRCALCLLIISFIMGTQVRASDLPLSVRNNNAGNIKYFAGNDWKGQIGSEKGFSVFVTKFHGLRAMRLVVTKNIIATKNINEFVLRYASEPNESINSPHIRAYSRAIKKHVGRNYLKLSDVESLLPLLVRLEGGQQAVDYFFGEKQMFITAKKMRQFKVKAPAKSYTGEKFNRYMVNPDGTVTIVQK